MNRIHLGLIIWRIVRTTLTLFQPWLQTGESLPEGAAVSKKQWHLLTFSAKSIVSLRAVMQETATFLETEGDSVDLGAKKKLVWYRNDFSFCGFFLLFVPKSILLCFLRRDFPWVWYRNGLSFFFLDFLLFFCFLRRDFQWGSHCLRVIPADKCKETIRTMNLPFFLPDLLWIHLNSQFISWIRLRHRFCSVLHYPGV